MEEKVLVTIKSNQVISGQTSAEELIDVMMAGTCAREGDDYVVRYRENLDDDGEMTALNTVRIGKDFLQVSKTGDVDVDMYYEAGKRSVAVYATPFGTMEMGISTNALTTRLSEDELLIRVAYALSINGSVAADCLLEIQIESLFPDAGCGAGASGVTGP